MKYSVLIVSLVLVLWSCSSKPEQHITGTWNMIYAETKTNNSLTVKDLNTVSFTKIITPTHFAFFNTDLKDVKNSYSGGGTYTLKDSSYIEVLQFTNIPGLKDQTFDFIIQFKGDTLIQKGHEHIPEAGISRFITEKYIKQQK
ncbi:hypothetical protein [Formosa sp. S-31]|uniref:hypothetical protein n=1 Tax=Formosa sp. S-31 TaxID=2790949 RepID=UPI003EBF33F4